MSGMSCTQLAENTGRKNLPFAHHRTTLSGYIFATKACIDSRKKKLVKQQYLLHVCLHCVEIQLTNGWVGELGAPQQILMGFASWLHYCTNIA